MLTQAVLPHPMLGGALALEPEPGARPAPHARRQAPPDPPAADGGGRPAGRGVARRWPPARRTRRPGRSAVPDHVLVRQTVDDCLHEGLSVEGLVELWSKVESGAIAVHTVESSEPSPLLARDPERPPVHLPRRRAARGAAHPGALAAPRPRRARPRRAARCRPTELARARSRGGRRWCSTRCCPRPRDPDELHDLLLSLVAARPVPGVGGLVRRAGRRRAGPSLLDGCWVATERRDAAASLGDDDERGGRLRGRPPPAGRAGHGRRSWSRDAPLPSGAPDGRAAVGRGRARTALARLEARGSAIELPDGRWCARNLLVRLHGASRSRRRRHGRAGADRRLRALPDALAARDARQPGRGTGRAARRCSSSWQGIEAPAAEWEAQILPARVDRLRPPLARRAVPLRRGGVGTPHPPAPSGPGRSGDAVAGHPARLRRARRPRARCCAPCGPGRWRPSPRSARRPTCWPPCASRGACFRPELAPLTGRLPAEVDEGLWDLVARGLVTADAFSAVRSLLSARDRWRTRTVRRPSGRLARRRRARGHRHRGGPVVAPAREPRCSGRPAVDDGVLSPGNEELAESVAQQLLARWGVVAWELWSRESFKVPWREVVWALRRLEARGVALGGRFVAGLSGEQYALPEAFEALQVVHRRGRRRRAGGRRRCRPAQHDRLHHRRRPRADTAQPARRLPRRHRGGTTRGGVSRVRPSGPSI